MNKFYMISLCGFALLGTGCYSVKEELGLNRKIPDEFTVMQRAPLEIPADLKTLPVPQPGLQRPQDVSAVRQAQQVVLGTDVSVSGGSSASENALLNKVGASSAPSDIRQKISEESGQGEIDNRPVIKRLLSIGKTEPSGKIVDAEAEAKRIQDAKKAGKPVTEGETPSLEE